MVSGMLPTAHHGLLVAVLFAACTSAPPPRVSPPLVGASSRVAASSPRAAFFADVMTRVRAQFIEEVSVGRLGEAALKGLEALPPKGAIRVAVGNQGAQLTYGESGSADATLSVSWPLPAEPVQVGEALDKAAGFTVTRLGPREPDVIDAMLLGLMSIDADGSYMAAAAFAAVQNPALNGSVGLEVAIRRDALTIVAPITGGPAQRAGLKAGDRIVSIDGITAKGLALPQVTDLLSGQRGSQVMLSVVQTGSSIPREFALHREIVPTPAVERKMIGRVGYLRVWRLPEALPAQMSAALDALRAEGAQALVLDLRACPGGALTVAIEVTELFLEDSRLITSLQVEPEIRTCVSRRTPGDPRSICGWRCSSTTGRRRGAR